MSFIGATQFNAMRGLGKDGENQQKIADAFDSIAQSIRGNRQTSFSSNIRVDGVTLAALGIGAALGYVIGKSKR